MLPFRRKVVRSTKRVHFHGRSPVVKVFAAGRQHIKTHRREAAIPHPLNPSAGSGQNLLNLLNPSRRVALTGAPYLD